jgi:glutamate N-acetyltransferase/amino-acid N-acetyltransferase
VRALVINSGNANAGTGVAGSNKGLDNAYQVCEMVAQSLDIDTEPSQHLQSLNLHLNFVRA